MESWTHSSDISHHYITKHFLQLSINQEFFSSKFELSGLRVIPRAIYQHTEDLESKKQEGYLECQ